MAIPVGVAGVGNSAATLFPAKSTLLTDLPSILTTNRNAPSELWQIEHGPKYRGVSSPCTEKDETTAVTRVNSKTMRFMIIKW